MIKKTLIILFLVIAVIGFGMSNVSASTISCHNGDANVLYMGIAGWDWSEDDLPMIQPNWVFNLYDGYSDSRDWFTYGKTKKVTINYGSYVGLIKITIGCGEFWRDSVVINNWKGADVIMKTETGWADVGGKNYKTSFTFKGKSYEIPNKRNINTLRINDDPLPTNLKINLSSDKITLGENMTLTVNLTDGDGNPKPNENISLAINENKTHWIKTNANGIATGYFTPDRDSFLNSVGKYNITAIFDGNVYYAPSTDNAVVSVVSPTNLTLNLSSKNSTLGESVTLTANLTNNSGNPIHYGNIIFNINGTNYSFSTDDNGIATFVFTPDVGEYNITATFEGSDKYYYGRSTDNAVLNVNPLPTNLVINPVIGTNGTIVDLTVQLKDNNFNTPINNKPINFTVDGKNIGNNNTNNNGVAVYHYKINEVKGNYTITGSFTGDEEYIASEGNNTLMVFNMNFMNVTATNPNGTVNITGSLIDDDGLGVGGVNVNCNNVTANTNPDGSFSIIDNEHHISPGDKTINSVNYNANDTVYVPPTITYNDFGKAYTLKVSYLFADNIILISFNYTFNTTEYAERYGGYYNYIQGRGINSTYDSNTGLIQINFDVPSNRIGEAMIYFYR